MKKEEGRRKNLIPRPQRAGFFLPSAFRLLP
jgi:hypothetical protein